MTTIVKCARGRITTRHGEDIGRDQFTGAKGHVGIDIGHGDSTAEDLKIVAPGAGRVTAVGKLGSYGLRIVITHDDGTWSLIAHLAAAFVKLGDRVGQGEHIGKMGNSGTVFVHAHQEYHLKGGAAVDPLDYMATTAGGGGTPIAEQPKWKGIMEFIIAAPNGVVVHIFPGHRRNFANPEEYNTARDQIAFLRATGASNALALPELAKVPKVSWATHDYLCDYVGAPRK